MVLDFIQNLLGFSFFDNQKQNQANEKKYIERLNIRNAV